MNVDFRQATAADADGVADVFLRSRKELVACAPLVHSDQDVRGWIGRTLIRAGRTTVATMDGLIVGFMTGSNDGRYSWIDHLYLLPGWIGRGIGTQLLDCARRELSSPIRLYTFQCNQGARHFYEDRGFKAIAFGDGSGNEEKCPDILYEWREEMP